MDVKAPNIIPLPNSIGTPKRSLKNINHMVHKVQVNINQKIKYGTIILSIIFGYNLDQYYHYQYP